MEVVFDSLAPHLDGKCEQLWLKFVLPIPRWWFPEIWRLPTEPADMEKIFPSFFRVSLFYNRWYSRKIYKPSTISMVNFTALFCWPSIYLSCSCTFISHFFLRSFDAGGPCKDQLDVPEKSWSDLANTYRYNPLWSSHENKYLEPSKIHLNSRNGWLSIGCWTNSLYGKMVGKSPSPFKTGRLEFPK